MNSDCLNPEKRKTLIDKFDSFSFSNLIKDVTCFKKDSKPSLLDVILTNKPNNCASTCNFNCGISDLHNMVSVQLKEQEQEGQTKEV